MKDGESKIEGLSSGEGLIIVSSHDKRQKDKRGQERERGLNLAFYKEPTPEITNPLPC